MKNIRYQIIVFPFLIIALMLGSCKDFFDINPDDMLNEKNNYKSVGDVYSGFLGLAANFQAVADQYILMSELMGDLLEPTANAEVEFWDIYRYKSTNGNPQVDPVKFYTIIVNCNDFFNHAITYNEENPNAIAENVYLGMMSSAMSFRAWAYLNIAKFYGHAYYFHESISNIEDISKFKKMELDELVLELISYLENGYRGIDAFNALNWNNILSNGDYSWNRHSVNPNALITELALWAGDYEKTIEEGLIAVTRRGVIGNPDNTTTKFTLNSVYGSAEWKTLFNGSYSVADNEAFTVVPFSFTNKQTHRLQYYFSNIGSNVYYFRPHESLIEKFSNQIQSNGVRSNDQHRGLGITYRSEGGEPVVYKYHNNKQVYEQDKHIFIYRTSDIFLMITEALSALGNFAAADSLLSVGLRPSWDGNNSVFLEPFDDPQWNTQGNLRECLGLRGRAGLGADRLKYYVEDDDPFERKQWVMDSLIAEETALEAAFEGKRWFTIMRIAKQRNRPEFLANEISKKFPEGEQETYRAYLMNPENWFIKYNQTEVK